MSDIPLDSEVHDGEQIQQTPVVEREPDIREQIAATLKAAQEAPENETPDQRSERLRDASTGKFVKGEKEPAANEKVVKRDTLTLKPQAKTPAELGTGEPQPTPAAAPVKSPFGWTPAELEAFKTAPPELQAAISRREADVQRIITKIDDERAFGKSVKEIAAPYDHLLKAEGADPLSLFKLYTDNAALLRTGTPEAKAYGIASVVQRFKVDPTLLISLLQQGMGNTSGGLPHPQNYMPQPAMVPQQDVPALVQAEIQNWQIKSEVERFEATQPKFYSLLKPTMAQLLQNGEAETLQDAYDKALDQQPDLRSILTAEQTTAEAEKQRQANLDRANQARRASGSIAGGPGAAKPNGAARPNGQSVEDDVREAMRAAMGRV